MWNMEVASLHFLEELAQIIVVERKCPHEERIKYHTARPDIGSATVVLLALKYRIRTHKLTSTFHFQPPTNTMVLTTSSQ